MRDAHILLRVPVYGFYVFCTELGREGLGRDGFLIQQQT